MQTAQNRNITLLSTATFLLWFSVYTYPSFLAAYAQETLLADAVMIGLITGSYGFMQMILRIPLGLWSDALGRRKPFLIGGAAASAVAALGLMLFPSRIGALLFRGISGVAAATWVQYSVFYSSCFPQEDLGRAMSRLSFYQYGSQVLASILGAFLADRLGKWTAFALAAAAAVCGIAITCGVREEKNSRGTRKAPPLLPVLRDKRLLCGTLLSTVFHFVCWGTVLGFTVNWAKEIIGLSTAALGFLSAAYLLPNTLIARTTGWLEEHIPRKVLLTGGFVIITAASLLYGATATAFSLFAVQVLFGVGMGLIIPTTMEDAIADIPAESRGTAMGFYQSVYGIGMFIGPLIAGGVVQHYTDAVSAVAGYRANFLVMALVGVLGIIAAALTVSDKKSK